MCPDDTATAGRAGQLRFGFVAVLEGHIVSKEKADQLLATGVVSHREELIQCIALHSITEG
jgi:hypothetical protein